MEARRLVEDFDIAQNKLAESAQRVVDRAVEETRRREHTVLTNQRLDDARREIALCKATLEKGLKRPVKHFAYCNGYYSAGVAQALKAEGFVSAVTTEDMPNTPGVDPFALKRKVLWEASSAGVLGFYSKPLVACQFEDTFGMLALQKPVLGARPAYFGAGRLGAEPGISAHG